MDRATYDKTIAMGEERLWNKNYCKVMTANFTLFFAFYLLTPLLPLYLSETFGATKDMIGLVLSGYTITALLFRPFSGYMVDSFPRKKVLMVCFGAFHCQNVAWRTFWRLNSGKLDSSYRRATLFTTYRRHRILWAEQQSCNGYRSNDRHLHL